MALMGTPLRSEIRWFLFARKDLNGVNKFRLGYCGLYPAGVKIQEGFWVKCVKCLAG